MESLRRRAARTGWWKAPMRFLPWAVSTPVLPPMLESTIASSVVGTCGGGGVFGVGGGMLGVRGGGGGWRLL